MDGGAWWAPVHGVTKSWTRLSDFSLSLSLFLSLSFSLSLSFFHQHGQGSPPGTLRELGQREESETQD